jgi:catechol 2,3-dioxygenase
LSTDVVADPGYGVPPPGYRLPGRIRLGPIRLQVASLAGSTDYYQRVLGLRVLERGEGTVVLGPQDDGTPLVELRERPGATPVPRRGRLGLYHFAILLPDRAALGRVLRHLSEAGEYAGTSDHFVSEAVYLTDPDGLGIEVYADRARGGWRYEGRQLFMQTEPLNVAEVLASAGGEKWTGIPAGTRIGHVHLFVSDLERAERFYHRGLGFDKVVWSYPGALFLAAGGYHHHLGTNTWAAGASAPTESDARLLEWTIIVPRAADADAAAESLEFAGYEVGGTPGNRLATDPWGTRVRVTV